VKRKFDVEESL